MSRWRREQVGVGVSSTAVALARRDRRTGAWQVRRQALPIDGRDRQAGEWHSVVNDLLGSVAEGREPVDLHVTVSNECVRWWCLQPPQGTRSMRDLQHFAQFRFSELYPELLAGEWQIQVDWRWSGASLCCAMPKPMMSSARAFGGLAVRCVGVVPVMERLREHAVGQSGELPPTCVEALIAEEGAMLRWWQHGRLRRVASFVVPAESPWPRLRQELQRVASMDADGESCGPLHWASSRAMEDPKPMDGLPLVPRLNGWPLSFGQSGRAEVAALLGVTP